jgi:hypothetical protein
MLAFSWINFKRYNYIKSFMSKRCFIYWKKL